MSAECDTTTDGFLNNSFKAIQPAKGAHRSGLDAILIAASIPLDLNGKVADFGAGCGVAGMAVAQRCAAVQVDLVEVDGASLKLAQSAMTLNANTHIADRIATLQADIEATGAARVADGLLDNTYNHIIANPPFNPANYQTSPNADKVRAHDMHGELFDKWARTAASASKAKGRFSMILRPENLQVALQALEGRFGSAKLLPIHPKIAEPANRIIISAVKGGKAALQILPPLIIHTDDGNFTTEADDIFKGRSGISL